MARLGRSFPQQPKQLHGSLYNLPARTVEWSTTDSFSFSDSLTRDLVYGRGPSDSIVLTESLDGSRWLGRGPSDTFSFSDAVLNPFTGDRELSDTFAASDAHARSGIFDRLLEDTFSFSDSFSGVIASEGTIVSWEVEDEFFWSDFVGSRNVILDRTPSETFSFSDSFTTTDAPKATYWTATPGGGVARWRRMEDFTYSEQVSRVDVDLAPIISVFPHWQVSSSVGSTIGISSEQSISSNITYEGLP